METQIRTLALSQTPVLIQSPQIQTEAIQTQDKAHANWGGFLLQDVLWAVGVWSVILILSPVVMFYVLMVN
jgi:hypothetical protein